MKRRRLGGVLDGMRFGTRGSSARGGGRAAHFPALAIAIVGVATAVLVVQAFARRPAGPLRGRASGGVVAHQSGADAFGVAGATSGKDAPGLLKDLGVGWTRVPVSWGEIEPQPGVYRWRQVENSLEQHQRFQPGIHVLVTIRARSAWAGERPKGKVNPKATLPPRDLSQYATFLRGLVERSRGVVDYWQIENEEESLSWWAGTADQYLELLRTASRTIRAADPGAKVVLGGFTSELTTVAALSARGESKREIARQLGAKEPGGPDVEAWLRARIKFIDDVLAGAGEYVDVVDIHLYNDAKTIPGRVQWLRGRMRAHGYEKPIWCTEMGGPDTQFEPYSDQAQATQVVTRATLALSSGVQKMFWLGLTEMQNQGERFNRMGLARRNGEKKPAFHAYRALIQELDGRPYQSSLSVPGGYGFRFGDRARSVWVLWSDQGARYRLQVGAPAVQVTYLDGRMQQVVAKDGAVELTLSGPPILVKAAPG